MTADVKAACLVCVIMHKIAIVLIVGPNQCFLLSVFSRQYVQCGRKPASLG